MPLECVILEGGGNAELRAWKAFGHGSTRSANALHAARKIVNTLSKKVMEDLSSEERRSVVDESSSVVLSLVKRKCVGAQCQNAIGTSKANV